MAQDDITRISIGEYTVGIVGLKQVLEEMAKEYSDRPQDEVQAELITRLSKTNYIPVAARGSYDD